MLAQPDVPVANEEAGIHLSGRSRLLGRLGVKEAARGGREGDTDEGERAIGEGADFDVGDGRADGRDVVASVTKIDRDSSQHGGRVWIRDWKRGDQLSVGVLGTLDDQRRCAVVAALEQQHFVISQPDRLADVGVIGEQLCLACLEVNHAMLYGLLVLFKGVRRDLKA